MALETIQTDVVQVLKNRRSPASFVGGATVFNASYPRRSADLDVYTEDASLSDIADGDIAAFEKAGFSVETNRSFYGLLVEAKVSRHDNRPW